MARLLSILGLYAATIALFSAGDPRVLLISVAVSPVLAWLSLADLDRREIPDTASALVAALGLASQIANATPAIAVTIALSVAVFCILGVAGQIHWQRYGQEALGLGDAKLIAAGTLLVGAGQFWVFLFFASASGIIAALLSQGKHPNGIPFGPFIAYAMFITYLLPGWS